MLNCGENIPRVTLNTTKGKIALEDISARHVLLFGYPKDFTPVCSTEIPVLMRQMEEFHKQGVQCIAVSTDTLATHRKWLRILSEHYQAGEENVLPVAEDPEGTLCKVLGVCGDDGCAERFVYVADTKTGKIELALMYPRYIGRSITALLHFCTRLCSYDKNKDSTAYGCVLGTDESAETNFPLQPAEETGSEFWDDLDSKKYGDIVRPASK